MQLTEMSNGVRLIVHPRPSVPLVAIYLWVQTGSVDEHADEHGAAHFLEHMLFKGTPKRGVGIAAGAIESLGGDLNAFTSHSNTVLHATVESSGWREALDVLVDMARNASIQADELEREREVILEEIRGYASDPDDVLSDQAQFGCWPNHPLGRPIVATVEEVKALTLENIVGYWRREWTGRRVILSVAGDVEIAAVQRAAAELLGDLPRGPERAEIPAPEMPVGPVLQRVNADFESMLVDLSWRVCDLNHADAAALEVLALALGDGPASMIPERLLLRDRMVSDPWAGTTFRAEGGLVSLGFVPRPGRTAEAVGRTLQELERIRADGVDGDVVDRTRAGVLADFLFAAETVDGLAYEDAWYTANYGNPSARAAARNDLARVTAEDI
ncbi:MAG: zinc protease, partial [Kiritimatiellia bacterium]